MVYWDSSYIIWKSTAQDVKINAFVLFYIIFFTGFQSSAEPDPTRSSVGPLNQEDPPLCNWIKA